MTLTALIASLYAWVNWSGARQLRNVEAMLKAEGETLDFRETMNEPVPEAENFCAIPLLKDLALVVDNDPDKGAPGQNRKRLQAMKLPMVKYGEFLPRRANAAVGIRTDLKGWADYLRKDGSYKMPADSGDAARDVLAALDKHDAIIQELAAGISRAKAQLTPEWKKRELPELLLSLQYPEYSTILDVARSLSLRVAASTRTGDAAKAHQAALLLARFNQACLNEPCLIGLLLGATETTMLHSGIWELCSANLGTVEDFVRLEGVLKSFDIHRFALRAFRSEMAAGVNAAQYCKRKPENIRRMSNNGASDDGVFSHIPERLIPSGFFDISAAVIAEHEFKYLVKPLREQGWQAAYQTSQEFEKQMVEIKRAAGAKPSYILLMLMAPALNSFISHLIYTDALVNQSIIACALERYRIEKGSYPDSLDAVRLADGKPLPLDPIHEKPMGYRNTADGKYALWSVGFDGKDDGGKRTLNEKKPENTQFHKTDYVGDWVWDFPAE